MKATYPFGVKTALPFGLGPNGSLASPPTTWMVHEVSFQLPISSFDLPKKHEEGEANEDVDPMLGYVFEPNAEAVLDMMLPYYIQYQVFQMILDARASEHSARMVAMKNATDNAKEFIKDLTLEYNKMRQASITTELLEIATAQMALGS